MITPGSLDYLYYNGILDHIPYEAYDYGFIGQGQNNLINPYSGLKQAFMNGTQYINAAKRGLGYNAYMQNDSFVRSNPMRNGNQNYMQGRTGIYGDVGLGSRYRADVYGLGAGVGSESDLACVACGPEEQNLRQQIVSTAASAKQSVLNAPSLVKGLIAAALLIATPILIVKAHKKPTAVTASNTFCWATSKWNPKNWFKK